LPLRFAALAVLCPLLTACPGPRTCTSPVDVWGDASLAPELAILVRNLDGTFAELTGDGMPIDLTFPIQGGHVLFVGARIKNLGACSDALSATLRDPMTQQILAFENRSVDFPLAASGGGTPELTDVSSLANVPACPDTAARDVVDTDWVLEVAVTDKQKRVARSSKTVRPRCSQPDPAARAMCECECRGDYFLGKCGRMDAGITDGGSTDGG
jgi:hypothetical protein